MARGDEAQVEIVGLVIATAWAADGSILEVAIHTAGEGVYPVEASGPGALLVRHPRRRIQARGFLVGGRGRPGIRLTAVRLLPGAGAWRPAVTGD